MTESLNPSNKHNIGPADEKPAAVGMTEALALMGVPWLLLVVLLWAGSVPDLYACSLLGLAFVAAALAAWRALGGGRAELYLLVFLVAMSIFRIWYVVVVSNELSGDEALFWECSRRLDWCYVTKGPVAPFCIYCTRMLLGNTVLGVRAPAIILSFAGSLLLYLLGRRIYNQRVGILSAALLQVTPIYAFNSIGMTTDPPLIFFWLTSLLLMHWAWHSACRPAWILLGLSVGLGILSKYTMAIFFLPALGLMLTSSARSQLRTPWPYLAVILCLLIITPLVIWNAHHGWLNFFHNFGQTHLSKSNFVSFYCLAEFVGSQLGIVTPLLLPMMLWASVKLRRQDPLCFWLSIIPLALFLLKSLQGQVLANWALVCYLPGLISFSAYFLTPLPATNVHLRRLAKTAVAVAVAITIALHLVCFLPFPPGLDPLTKFRRGSAELGNIVAKLSEKLQPRRFIFSNDYMTASLLAFYIDGQPHTYCVNLGRRFNEFDVWPTFHDLHHYDAVLVIKGNLPMPDALQSQFTIYQKCLVKTLSTVGGIENTYSVFLCRDFRGMEKIVPTRYN